MYFCGMFNIEDWDPDAAYIIIDDFNIKFCPWWKCVLGAQKTFVLTDKYRKKRTVKWGKPCIWLCNRDDDPRGALSGAELEWFRANVVEVDIYSPLF